MKKILHFASVVNKNDFVDSVVSNLDKKEYEVQVCTFSKTSELLSKYYQAEEIKEHTLNISKKSHYVKAVFKIIKIIKEEKIDILHTHMYHEAFIGAWVKLLYPKVKLIIGRHYSDELYQTSKGLNLQKSLFIENFSNNNADKIIAASSIIESLLLNQNVKKNKIARVNYGFDFTSPRYLLLNQEACTTFRKELNIEPSTFVVLNIARHYFLKGQSYLIEAFSHFIKTYPDSLLILAGTGPDTEKLKKLTVTLNIEGKVFFAGFRNDGNKLISISNIFVHPTFTEAFPQVMVETMALGKLLAITNVSGACDQVKNMETGIIIDRSVESIINALKFTIQNPTKIIEIGKRAQQYVRTELDIQKVIKDYESLYANVLEE